MRIGHGYDSHRFAEGRRLVLGGVEMESARGLLGHSDADALAHAVIDALLGAAGLGDIGSRFPDTSPEWEGADSMRLLEIAAGEVRRAGFEIGNVDATVICEEPKIRPHSERMRARLAAAAGISPTCISVKGKTNEGMGDVGRGLGVAVHVVCILEEASRRPVFGEIAACDAAASLHRHFPAAFDFLKKCDFAAMADGRYDIVPGGECYAAVQTSQLRQIGAAQCEAHGRYIDIHVPISGIETIGFGLTPREVVAAGFPEENDIAFFDAPVEFRDVAPGQFAIFFPPWHAHIPCLSRSGLGSLRKAVVKVKLNETFN